MCEDSQIHVLWIHVLSTENIIYITTINADLCAIKIANVDGVKAYSSDPVRRDNEASTLLGQLHLFIPHCLRRLTLVTKLAT